MLTREVDCTIARRLLVNYRVDPEVVAAQLRRRSGPRPSRAGPSAACASLRSAISGRPASPLRWALAARTSLTASPWSGTTTTAAM